MHKSYGQYCPLALASELLGGRWTLLVASRVIEGFSTYNEIFRGVPRISPSMLSKRLEELEDAGIIERKPHPERDGHTYHPTNAGKELEPIINNLAIWGQQWARDNSMDDLDLAFLAWSMHLRVDSAAMPAGRTVLEFELSYSQSLTESFWLVNEDGKVEMCMKHPGYDTDVLVRSDIRVFVEAWRGFRDLREEIYCGNIEVSGPRELKRDFPDWLQLSMFADHKRKRAGREKHLCDGLAVDVE